MKQKGIHPFSMVGNTEASTKEGFNHMHKEPMNHYLTVKNTMNFLPAHQALVKGYNDSYHCSIRMAPKKVNAQNKKEIWDPLSGKPIKSLLKVRDCVRLNKNIKSLSKAICQTGPKSL